MQPLLGSNSNSSPSPFNYPLNKIAPNSSQKLGRSCSGIILQEVTE